MRPRAGRRAEGARRTRGRPARQLRRADQPRHSGATRRHDGEHASLPRQFRSTWVAAGGYEPVAEALFNQIDADAYFMEYDCDRAGGFEPLRFVPRGRKMVVLGLVTSKTGAIESKDELKRRIDQAAKYLPLEQLALSPQCGFASTEEGNLLSEEEQWAKLRLCVEVAREVWGAV